MENEFKCSKCDYTTTKKGYLEQHVKFKHAAETIGKGKGNQKNYIKGKEKKKEDGVFTLEKCPDCEGLNIKLLNSYNSNERKAINHGFKKMCRDCEEVF